jgi:hypothetical protein
MTDLSTYRLDPLNDDAARWRSLFDAVPRPALEQSWAFGEAMAATEKVTVERSVVSRDEAPLALVQAFRRKLIGGFSLVRVVRGPVWLKEPDLVQAGEILRVLRSHWRPGKGALFSLVPELPAGDDADNAMRAAGMRRMVTGYSTIWVDLAPDIDALRAGLDGKWRNALVKAEAGNIRLQRSQGGDVLHDLTARYDAFRKTRRFLGPDGKLARAMVKASNDVTVLSAHQGDALIAGIVLVRHGPSATYFISWSGEAGREINAHNLLLWRAIETLKKDGVRWFDLGGVDAVRAPGIARFKLGIGGRVTTLAGSYL